MNPKKVFTYSTIYSVFDNIMSATRDRDGCAELGYYSDEFAILPNDTDKSTVSVGSKGNWNMAQYLVLSSIH